MPFFNKKSAEWKRVEKSRKEKTLAERNETTASRVTPGVKFLSRNFLVSQSQAPVTTATFQNDH
jgi:predicted lipoprotein